MQLALILLFTPLFAVTAYRQVPAADESLENSSRDYLLFAYNLAHSSVFSRDRTDPIRPSSYREPLYASLLALGILATPDLRRLPRQEFVRGWNLAHSRVRLLLVVQAALLFATAFLVAGIVGGRTGHPAIALAALYAVGLSPALQHYIHGYMPELLAALLMTVLAALLAAVVRKPSPAGHAAAGVTLGLLTLTRAIFQYLYPIIGLLLLMRSWHAPAKRRRAVLGVTVFTLGYAIVVGPWIVRNYHVFSRVLVAGRSGVVLNTRAWYDRMDRTEYLASFLYWTPGAEGLLKRFFKPVEYARLTHNRFYQIPHMRVIELEARYGDEVVADKALFNEALEWIIRHPFRHLAVTLPLVWRGINPTPLPPVLPPTPEAAAEGIIRPGGPPNEYLPFVSPILFGCLFFTFFRAIRRRDEEIVALLLPSFYCFTAYLLVTENHFRYSVPVLPIAWTSFLILGHSHFLRIRSQSGWQGRDGRSFMALPNEASPPLTGR